MPFADRAFERVFTAHFYGHLLPGEREAFVGEARRVGGELVVVDSARAEDEASEHWQERVLDDGSRRRVYKRYFVGGELANDVRERILHEGRWFIIVVA